MPIDARSSVCRVINPTSPMPRFLRPFVPGGPIFLTLVTYLHRVTCVPQADRASVGLASPIEVGLNERK